LWPAVRAAQLTLLAIQLGCPAVCPMSRFGKPFEYMNAWNWSAPSSSQMSPSAVWAVRRLSDVK
jgi:hypothetical protein